MMQLLATAALSYSSTFGVTAVRVSQPAGEPDMAYQEPGYVPVDEAADPSDLLQPPMDFKALANYDKMDNEKCRILCQSPYSCRPARLGRFMKAHELCQRWGMHKLGDAFEEEMYAVHLDLGACMRKCDKVFALEEGIKSAPLPSIRNTPAPVTMASQSVSQADQDGEGSPEALPALSPEELKKEDEEYARETAPQTSAPEPQAPAYQPKFKYRNGEDILEDHLPQYR